MDGRLSGAVSTVVGQNWQSALIFVEAVGIWGGVVVGEITGIFGGFVGLFHIISDASL